MGKKNEINTGRMDLCTEHRLLDHKELTHRHMRVSERSPLEPILICFLFQSLSIWMNFIQTKSSEETKNRRRQLSCTPVFVHTPRRWCTLLGVCGRMRRWSWSARFRSQPLLKVELGKSGSLRAHLPGRIEEVAIRTSKGCGDQRDRRER